MIFMIPFGLLAGFWDEKEVRITGVDEAGFYFRVRKEAGLKNDMECAANPVEFKICFYDIEKEKYNEIKISEYELSVAEEENSEFYQEYLVKVEQDDYVQAVQKLLVQYNRYIHLKLEEDDSTLAEKLTGYPGELDVVKCCSLEDQVKIWKNEARTEEGKRLQETLDSGRRYCAELAVSLDRPELYQMYLNNQTDKFLDKYEKKPDRLYIGNQFCHLLFPKKNQLFQMMEKAVSEQLQITVAFSYIREYMLDSVSDLLCEMDRWCEEKGISIEVVVNDWGMASLLKKQTQNLISSLGVLLNKRKKDPRISYKKGDKKLFERNNVNAAFYRDFLKKEFGIQRFEWESCGYEQQFPEEKNSLHIPFYQTNTSQYCPLQAVYLNGERGRQKLAKECPGYCEEYVLLYPEHLHMVGRYNSLFGIDMQVLEDADVLERYIENGVDRIVINGI